MLDKLVVKTSVAITGGGDVSGTPDGLINAAGEVLTCSIEDLLNVTLHISQVLDNGTVTMNVEASLDGTNWETIGAAITEASFAAANNVAISRSLSDANGMPLCYKLVRLRCPSVYTGTGTYTLAVAGRQNRGR